MDVVSYYIISSLLVLTSRTGLQAKLQEEVKTLRGVIESQKQTISSLTSIYNLHLHILFFLFYFHPITISTLIFIRIRSEPE